MNRNTKIALGAVTASLLVLLPTSVAFASNSANPGDFLYGVDKTVENIQRTFSFGTISDGKLELKLMDERIEEFKKLAENSASEAELTDALGEIESQQTKLQAMLDEMSTLRDEGKLTSKQQLEFMKNLRERLNENKKTLDEIKKEIEKSDNQELEDSVEETKNNYEDELNDDIDEFEQETGEQVHEIEEEQNSGDDSQIENQNQNQVQNGDSSDSSEDEVETEDENDSPDDKSPEDQEQNQVQEQESVED